MYFEKAISLRNKQFNVFADTNSNAFWDNVSNNSWEQYTYDVLDSFIKKDSVVLDIGAEHAAISIYAALLPSKKVYAVEPSINNIQIINRNINANKQIKDKIVVCHGCMASTSGKQTFSRGSKLFNDIHFTVTNPDYEVQSFTIEDFASQYSIEKIDFIKMDIEGGEYIILPSMERYLKMYKPTILVSLHPGFVGRKMTNNFNKFINIVQRYIDHLYLCKIFSSYKYCYNIITRKPIKLIELFSFEYIRGKKASDCSILFTDIKWE